ncbi:MAG: zf-HC2 domain-containing protein [Gaiellaceae bacterium]
MGQFPSTDCDWVRASASAAVDGELSEVEALRLDTHLASCADCRAFAGGVAQTTRMLQEAPLEQLGFAIELPSRRLAFAHKLQVATAAAAVAVTVGVSGIVGGGWLHGSPASTQAASSANLARGLHSPEAELKMLHQASVARSRLVIHSRLAL